MHESHGYSAPRRPRSEPMVSLDGLQLIWITTILFVPAIFGLMFLEYPWRMIVGFGLLALTILYSARELRKTPPPPI
jgi:hypothetical protein